MSNPSSKALYEEANQFVEKWHKIINFAFVKVTLPFITLPYAVWSYYLYFNNDSGPDSFHLPFPVWFPFEWRHPIGYLLAFIIEFIVIYYAIMFCSVFVCFPFGTCHFMATFAIDIKMELNTLNELNEGDEVKLLEKLYSIIEFHAIAKG